MYRRPEILFSSAKSGGAVRDFHKQLPNQPFLHLKRFPNYSLVGATMPEFMQLSTGVL